MKSIQRLTALAAMTVFLGAGCWSSEPVTPGVAPAGERPSVSGAGGCNNPYYPLTPGHKTTFRTSGTGVDSSTIMFEFKESATADFKLDQTINTPEGVPLVLSTEGECRDGAIMTRGYADFGSAITGLNIRTETESVDGVFMPANLAVGSEWTTTYRTVLHTDDSRLRAMLDGKRQTVTITNKAVGMENVTVPAGTFRALKVEQTTKVSSELAGLGEITVPGTLWLVQGVGMVKVRTDSTGTSWSMEATEVTR